MTTQPITLVEGAQYRLGAGCYLEDSPEAEKALRQAGFGPEDIAGAARGSMAMQILDAHALAGSGDVLQLKFDALVSPDNNYVSILQTVRAAGITRYPVPYILTNCHNAYCAVSGTSNEDDHVFGLACQKKYGGLFVPRYCAVLHQYIRETVAGGGKMVLGSDSHTRYGALGTLGIGEGGGEIAKQLMGVPYALRAPQVIAVELTGAPAPGVGPHDIALALIAAVQPRGFVKNRILEFVGPGIASLSMDTRLGIDAMTTEAGGLSSIWMTDEATARYLERHGRGGDFRRLSPAPLARYDGLVRVDLSRIEPMIALPFHPSVAYPIRELNDHPALLEAVDETGRQLYGESFSLAGKLKDGRLCVDQAMISGCTGGLFENIVAARDVLRGCVIGSNAPNLGINPASMQVSAALGRSGVLSDLLSSGAIVYPPGCGSCFGVTDIPANGQLSVRHVTRNFAGREGAQKGKGQFAAVALMDARSIAATVRCGGRLTAATELDVRYTDPEQTYDPVFYTSRVYNGYDAPRPETPVPMGPGISNWPPFPAMPDHLVLMVSGIYRGAVTTDDLIPSGEASSLRSNPVKLSDYLLSGRDKRFVGRAKELCAMAQGDVPRTAQVEEAFRYLAAHCPEGSVRLGGILCADELGEGSSREQAVSCQRILGGCANLALEYPTKRYRTNCLNWGILPLQCEQMPQVEPGDVFVLPGIAALLREGAGQAELLLIRDGACQPVRVRWGALTQDEVRVLLSGCIINDFCRQGS
ncbi:MAG: hydratase [Aristaeellaceae bacterium]